jgi:hypothetical protein
MAAVITENQARNVGEEDLERMLAEVERFADAEAGALSREDAKSKSEK